MNISTKNHIELCIPMKKLILFSFLILSLASLTTNVSGQDTSSLILDKIKNLIAEESYNKAVGLINQSLRSQENVPDSIKAELNYYNYLARGESREESLLKAIDLYEKLNNVDSRRLSLLYRTFLTNPYNGDKKTRNDIAIKLFQNRYIYASDFKYLDHIYSSFILNNEDNFKRLHIIDSVTVVLKSEGVNPQYFSSYIKYIKARLLSRDLYLFSEVNRNLNSKRMSIEFYCDCLHDYDKIEECEPIEYLKEECLEQLADEYAYLQMFDVAAIYQRRYLDILHKYWKVWGADNPWQHHSYFSGSPMSSYEKYIDYLSNSNQFDKGITFCNDVLKEIINYQIKDSDKIIQDKIDMLIRQNGSYHSKDNRFSATHYWSNRRLSKLYHNKDYDKLIQVADSIINADCYNYLKNLGDNYIGSYFEDDSIKSTKGDDILFAKREMYWYSNGNQDYWEALMCKALIASYHKNFEQAIQYQNEVVDIVKTDYKYGSSKLELLYDRGYNSIIYLSNEIKQYIRLSEYCLRARYNEDAIHYLKMALNSTVEIYSFYLFGSNSSKDDLYEMCSDLLLEILSIGISYVKSCPELADICLDITTLTESMSINERTALHNAINDLKEEENPNLLKAFKQITELNRTIDNTYYTNEEELRDDLILKRALLQNRIDQKIDITQILKSSIINTEKINKFLEKGDVFISFIPMSSSADTIEYALVDSLINNTYIAREVHKHTIFSIVYKPEWKHAQIIEIGDNLTGIGDGIGALALYEDINSKEADEFYNSPIATDYIWGKVLKATCLSKNSNIYFVPGGELRQIAIEQLQMKDGNRICDNYNMFRLSSASEISRPISTYNNNDHVAIFCDLNFNWLNTSVIPQRFRMNLTKPHSDEINRTLHDMITSNLTEYSRDLGTEEQFTSLSGHAPEYLIISTHGFNMLYDVLEKSELNYLIGYRTEYQKNADESMFKTGLYLSSTQKNSRPSNDGLLTSHEISLLDLSSTKLCVLSACSTGKGYNTFKGTFGLQRAFKLSGVKTLLVSLWDIDSQATNLLISKFCTYIKTLTPQKALQKAQMDIRNYVSEDDYVNGLDIFKYKNPYYWAGFILLDANE